tara:strand:+ start:4286 stop:6808 length:2523 start_codon:yes stop_codon:yes gene_type:complete
MFEEDPPDADADEVAASTQASHAAALERSAAAMASNTESTQAQIGAVETLSEKYKTLDEELETYAGTVANATDNVDQLRVGLIGAGVALGGITLANLMGGPNNQQTGSPESVLSGLIENVQAAKGQASGMLDAMLSQVAGLFDVMQAHGGPLREEFFEIQKAFGGTFGEIETVGGKANAQSAEAVRAMGELYEGFYANIPGTRVAMFDLFEDQTVLSSVFHQMATDNRDAVAFLAGDSEETTRSTALAMSALNISATDASLFVQRQIDRTGEANDDMLMQVAKTIKATESASGISSKIIAGNVVDMTKDVANFGNMTDTSMAAASAQMAQMGLDFQSLSSVVGQFQSFEGAAQAAADLNAVFGINIDVTEAMMAANQGQEHMLDLVRTSMLDAGITSENLTDNMSAARIAAHKYGLSVDDLQRVLAAQDVQGIQEILEGQQAAQEEMPEDFGQTELVATFENDMARIQRSLGKTAEEFKEAFSDAQAAAAMGRTQREMALIAEDTERAANASVLLAGGLGAMPGELLAGSLEGFRDQVTGPDGFMGEVADEMRSLSGVFEEEVRPVAIDIGTGMGVALGDELKAQLADEENGIGKLKFVMTGFLNEAGLDAANIATEIDHGTEVLEAIGSGIVGMALGTVTDSGLEVGRGFAAGISDALSDPDTSGQVANDAGILFDHMAQVARDQGLLGDSPSPFGRKIVGDLNAALAAGAGPDGGSVEAAAAAMLGPLTQLGSQFEEVSSVLADQISARGTQIAAQFTDLATLNLTSPDLAPVEVSLAGGITRLNEASQALITAATEGSPNININLSLELTDEGKGNLIASLANGSVSGGQGVLTQRT